MQKKFFRIAILAGAVFVTSQTINLENAHAFDLGAFANQHSGKIDDVLKEIGLDSLRDQITNKNDKPEERSSTKNSASDDDKWSVDSLLSHPTLKKLR